jgi:predicted DNA-binding transcriptional regulator AlpA
MPQAILEQPSSCRVSAGATNSAPLPPVEAAIAATGTERRRAKSRPAPRVANKTAARVSASKAGQPPPEKIKFTFKPEVLDRVGVTYPTLWAWMRKGEFPQSYDVGGKVAWIESEIDAWCAERPVRKLKPAANAR